MIRPIWSRLSKYIFHHKVCGISANALSHAGPQGLQQRSAGNETPAMAGRKLATYAWDYALGTFCHLKKNVNISAQSLSKEEHKSLKLLMLGISNRYLFYKNKPMKVVPLKSFSRHLSVLRPCDFNFHIAQTMISKSYSNILRLFNCLKKKTLKEPEE